MKKTILSRARDNIVATIIYGLITFALTIFYEKYLLGLNWGEWMGTRGIYIVFRYTFLFVLDYLIDFFRQHLPKGLADAVALSTYQIPIYATAALIIGLDYQRILLAAAIYLADNLALGWLYGYILDRTRKFFLQQAL
ncbi:MAG: L-alanine exporter AlaE [Patescibacteria group bacterium]|nr:L-alanine exporter AlaE [Patescibacteria group bacterium]